MALLSRVATTLYVFGRELEWAEHLARVLRVHAEVSLDRSLPRDRGFWARFLVVSDLAGDGVPAQVGGGAAIRLAAEGHARSIARSIERARRAAQSIRPQLSTEVWEQINRLYYMAREELGADRLTRGGGLYQNLHAIELTTQLVSGLVDGTMSHDEAWEFVRLSKYFARALGTTRLVVREAVELESLGEDAVTWSAVLRCCSSFESYRQRFAEPVDRSRVVAHLLLEERSPRAVAFCLDQALAAVRNIEGEGRLSAPHRALGRLQSLVTYADPAQLTADPSGFGRRFDREAVGLSHALSESYFQPIEAVHADESIAVTPQQQQQRRGTA